MRRGFAVIVLSAVPILSLVGCGGASRPATTTSHPDVVVIQLAPPSRLIVLGKSIAGVRLNESRQNVERELGAGSSRRPGVVSYFGGRLIVDYWFHEGLTKRVQGLETSWAGFHTRTGVRIGSPRDALRALGIPCGAATCSQAAGRMPDAPGTVLSLRHGHVVRINIFYA